MVITGGMKRRTITWTAGGVFLIWQQPISARDFRSALILTGCRDVRLRSVDAGRMIYTQDDIYPFSKTRFASHCKRIYSFWFQRNTGCDASHLRFQPWRRRHDIRDNGSCGEIDFRINERDIHFYYIIDTSLINNDSNKVWYDTICFWFAQPIIIRSYEGSRATLFKVSVLGGSWQAVDMTITILYSFSSVAHVWVPGAKTTGPIVPVKKFVFSWI
jgi:hypothetical protein